MTRPTDPPSGNEWDPDDYDDGHTFVYEYGDAVLELFDPDPEESVLDLGCDTGHLTAAIGEPAGTAVGFDRSRAMIAER